MANVRLNDTGFAQARAAIEAGKIELESPWSFSKEDQAAIIQAGQWQDYAGHHLGIRTGADRNSKRCYAYPVMKEGLVYRSAVVSARVRSAQQNHAPVFHAAGDLLVMLSGGEDRPTVVAHNMRSIGAATPFAASFELVDFDDLPTVVLQLLPFTDGMLANTEDGRRLRVTERSLEMIQQRFQERDNPIPVDYEHGILFPVATDSGKAAGWIWELWPITPEMASDPSSIADDRIAKAISENDGKAGVYAEVSLTSAAAEAVREREYMFVSPVVIQNDDDEVIEIVAAALTNLPNLQNMIPIAAKAETSATMVSATHNDDEPPESAGEGRDGAEDNPNGGYEMDLKALSAIVGRPLSDEKEATEAIAAMKAQADQAKANAAKVEELETDARKREADSSVSGALKAGKISEDQKTWAHSLAMEHPSAWEAYLEATPDGAAETVDPRETGKPPQGHATRDANNDSTDNEKSTGNVRFFKSFSEGARLDDEDVRKLNDAIAEAHKSHKGDLARAIRARR